MGDWKENMGLSDDTDVVKIYTNTQVKQEWKEEADAHNRSLSRHLFVIIQEARYLQQEGELSFPDPPREPDKSIEVETESLSELTDEIEELGSQLEEQQELIDRLEEAVSRDGSGDSFDRRLMRDVLDDEGKEFEQLTEGLLEHLEFQSWLENEVENKLYSLGADGEVRFELGQGWKIRKDS